MILDARIAERMLKREILQPVGELSATSLTRLQNNCPLLGSNPGLLSDVRSSTTTRPTLLLKLKSCQHGVRDAFLDWLDNEDSEQEIQIILCLLAELYTNLKGQASVPACIDDYVWPAEDVFKHYLNVYRHSEAVCDAAVAQVDQWRNPVGSHLHLVQ